MRLRRLQDAYRNIVSGRLTILPTQQSNEPLNQDIEKDGTLNTVTVLITESLRILIGNQIAYMAGLGLDMGGYQAPDQRHEDLIAAYQDLADFLSLSGSHQQPEAINEGAAA